MVGKYLRVKATGLQWPAHTASAAAICPPLNRTKPVGCAGPGGA